jgi:cyclase
MRLTKVTLGAILAGVVSVSSHAFAQGSQCFAGGPWLPNPMEAHQLKSDVYWVEGGGGNSTVIVGDKGVIVVDTKVSKAAGGELLANIAKITSKPVTTVILTHSDGDHSNGLAAFPPGIKIIAQDGANKELLAAVAKGGPGAISADHLPTQIITQPKETLTIEGETIELFHWVPAHTK